MREIPLTQGKVALVDDEDFEALPLLALKWYARIPRGGLEVWYAVRNLSGPKRGALYMHAYIMGTVGCGHRITVDHIDGDGLNNQRSNLRLATKTQQRANTKKLHGTLSQFKGVHRSKGKWRATIQFEYRVIHLGYFDSEIDAAHAYDLAAETYFGPFAKLNLGGLNAVQIAAR
jgi:hypothetical protein